MKKTLYINLKGADGVPQPHVQQLLHGENQKALQGTDMSSILKQKNGIKYSPWLEGLKIREISKELSRPEGTIKADIRKGKRALQKAMGSREKILNTYDLACLGVEAA